MHRQMESKKLKPIPNVKRLARCLTDSLYKNKIISPRPRCSSVQTAECKMIGEVIYDMWDTKYDMP